MTFDFFSSTPSSDNLTHDIKIIRVRFSFAPAPYWSSVSVVYRHDTEKTLEWFPSDDMSPFLMSVGLRVCAAQCHSLPPDLAKRLFTTVKKLSVLVFWGFQTSMKAQWLLSHCNKVICSDASCDWLVFLVLMCLLLLLWSYRFSVSKPWFPVKISLYIFI